MENECSARGTRVLLVEDHPGFQRYIRSTLASSDNLELVAVAGDGLDGVEKCIQLQPDIVLMDIGLPQLNGIEAARRIRVAVPQCKIIFLTQEHAPEILEEALKLGASGYVLKTRAARDLFPAMQAACGGTLFVSSDGTNPRWRQATATSSFRAQTVPGPGAAFTHSHEIHLYSDEKSSIAGLASFIERSLKAQKGVLAFLTEERGGRILAEVERSGVDVKELVAAGCFIPRQVADLARELLLIHQMDRVSLTATCVEMVETMLKKNPGRQICVCGECAGDLFAKGHAEAAMLLESIWDEVTRRYHLETFCTYLLSGTHEDDAAYEQICATHTLVAQH